jgi:hypothetical protein
MNNKFRCKNCHSPRRQLKALGFCSLCYRWQHRIKNYLAELELVRSDPAKYYRRSRVGELTLGMAVARRVLEELRWRETRLLENRADTEDLETLISTLARSCRSELATNTRELIEQMSGHSRRLMFEILLCVIENIPSRWPKLHYTGQPKKGWGGEDGWSMWFRERTFSQEFAEDVKLSRELEMESIEKRNHHPSH